MESNVSKHPETPEKGTTPFLSQQTPPLCCRGCTYTPAYPSGKPCCKCSRPRKDFYQAKADTLPTETPAAKKPDKLPDVRYVANPAKPLRDGGRSAIRFEHVCDSAPQTTADFPSVLFALGDLVRFRLRNKENGERVLTGVIEVVDAHGTFEQQEEPSYDIYVKADNMFYKHVRQSSVMDKVRTAKPEERLF